MSGFITVVYARSHSLGGLLIRHADRLARWSHCGVLLRSAATVVEARAMHGVVATPYEDFACRYGQGRVERVSVQCPDPLAGEHWALQQLGSGYDYLAVLGGAMRQSWQEPGRWMCSELVEMALHQAGAKRFRDGPSRISPNVSYMVA